MALSGQEGDKLVQLLWTQPASLPWEVCLFHFPRFDSKIAIGNLPSLVPIPSRLHVELLLFMGCCSFPDVQMRVEVCRVIGLVSPHMLGGNELWEKLYRGREITENGLILGGEKSPSFAT